MNRTQAASEKTRMLEDQMRKLQLAKTTAQVPVARCLGMQGKHAWPTLLLRGVGRDGGREAATEG